MKLIAIRDERDKDIYHVYQPFDQRYNKLFHVCAIHIDSVTKDIYNAFDELNDGEVLNMKLIVHEDL